MGKQWKQCQAWFFGAPKSLQMVIVDMKLRRLLLGRKVMTNLDRIYKSRDITLPTRSVWPRLWFFQWSCMDVRVGLWRKLSTEKLMLFNCGAGKDSSDSLDCKEIQPVHPKGDQSWVFIGRTDAEAETLILWPPHAKSWLIGKDPDARRDWGQEEKGTTVMDGWMASLTWWAWVWVNSGVGDGQGGLACCDSWGAKSRTWLSDWTELNW